MLPQSPGRATQSSEKSPQRGKEKGTEPQGQVTAISADSIYSTGLAVVNPSGRRAEHRTFIILFQRALSSSPTEKGVCRTRWQGPRLRTQIISSLVTVKRQYVSGVLFSVFSAFHQLASVIPACKILSYTQAGENCSPLPLYLSPHCSFFFFLPVFCAKLPQSCPTLWDPMDCSLPGSSVHGVLQARILEWVATACLQGIFPTQGSNLHLLSLLHWWAASFSLVPAGKPGALSVTTWAEL